MNINILLDLCNRYFNKHLKAPKVKPKNVPLPQVLFHFSLHLPACEVFALPQSI